MPSSLQTASDSGEKIYEVTNATGTVQASFEKLDTSTRHTFTLEIYKDQKLLTSGSTTAGFCSVILSVDVTSGVAQPAKTSCGSLAASTGGSTPVPTTTAAKANQTASATTAPANMTSGH